ncbi:MAG: hypothetical protein GEU86_07730 [Actinophytocola sp.]|nr:hypothetical protein [Actinophytocola sp.]
MGTSHEVQIKALREAARAAGSAADQVSKIDLAAAVAAAGEGMPGSRSASSLSNIASRWSDDVSRWVSQANGYAQALTTAADRYAADEAAAEQDFDRFGDDMREPR